MSWQTGYEKLGFRYNESGSEMQCKFATYAFRAKCVGGVVTVSANLCGELPVERSSLESDPLRAWDLLREHITSLARTMKIISDAIENKATRGGGAGEVRVEVKGITSTQPAAIKRGNYGMMGDHD